MTFNVDTLSIVKYVNGNTLDNSILIPLSSMETVNEFEIMHKSDKKQTKMTTDNGFLHDISNKILITTQ